MTPRGGRREREFLLGDPQGVEGIKAGIGTSVIREAVTDAYGASTLRYMINLMLKCVTPAIGPWTAHYLE